MAPVRLRSLRTSDDEAHCQEHPSLSWNPLFEAKKWCKIAKTRKNRIQESTVPTGKQHNDNFFSYDLISVRSYMRELGQ